MATFKGTCTRERGKKVATQDGRGWTTVPDGVDHADITVTIDVDALIRSLGKRAMASSGQKAVEASGMVTVRASNMRRG